MKPSTLKITMTISTLKEKVQEVSPSNTDYINFWKKRENKNTKDNYDKKMKKQTNKRQTTLKQIKKLKSQEEKQVHIESRRQIAKENNCM